MSCIEHHAYRTVAPTAEPISLVEVKERLSIDHTDDDLDLALMITAAREWLEDFSGRAFIDQTWKLTLSQFPQIICLPRPPFSGSTLTTFTYIDTAGTSQSVSASDYTLDYQPEPATIREAYSRFWPAARDVFNAVQITWVAGYGAAATSVPQEFRQALFMLVGTMYELQTTIVNEQTVAQPSFIGVAKSFAWPRRFFQDVPWRQ